MYTTSKTNVTGPYAGLPHMPAKPSLTKLDPCCRKGAWNAVSVRLGNTGTRAKVAGCLTLLKRLCSRSYRPPSLKIS